MKNFYIFLISLSTLCSGILQAAESDLDRTTYGDGAVALLLIGSKGVHTACLGSFIDPLHVITAAHCVLDPLEGKKVDYIYVQSPEKHNLDTSGFNPGEIKVETITVHPDYKGKSYADLAILKLPTYVNLPINDVDRVLDIGNIPPSIAKRSKHKAPWNMYRSRLYVDQSDTLLFGAYKESGMLYSPAGSRLKARDFKEKLVSCGISVNKLNYLSSFDINYDDYMVMEYIESTSLGSFEGASGSPLLMRDIGDYTKWILGGIHSGSSTHQCGETFYTTVTYVNPYGFSDWIDSVTGHQRSKRDTDFDSLASEALLGVHVSGDLWTKDTLGSTWEHVPTWSAWKVSSVAVMHDKRILGIGMGKMLNVKSSLSGDWSVVPDRTGWQVTDVAVMNDGTILGIGLGGFLCTKATLESDWVRVENSGVVMSVATMPDGKILAVGMNNELYVKDTLSSPWVYVKNSGAIKSVTVLPSGKIVGIGMADDLWTRDTLESPWVHVPGSTGWATQDITPLGY